MAPIIRVLMRSGIVENMDIEDYLGGVVVKEMYTSWHMEALKAQAIAARTYAMWYVIRNAGRGSWDVTTTTAYQAYVSYRHSRTTAAVDATRGITGGTRATAQIVKTYYHACCGGHTYNTFGHACLKSVPCPCVCVRTPHGNGLCQYGAKFLAERGYNCFQILDFYYNAVWYGEYLMLGEVSYDHTPTSPWPGPIMPPEPEPEPEPEPGLFEQFFIALFPQLVGWFAQWKERSPKVLRDWWTKTQKTIDEWFANTYYLIDLSFAHIAQVCRGWYNEQYDLCLEWFSRLMTLAQLAFNNVLNVCLDWYWHVKSICSDWYQQAKFIVYDWWLYARDVLNNWYYKIKDICVDSYTFLFELATQLPSRIFTVVTDWWANTYWVVKSWIPNVYSIVSNWWAATKATVHDWIAVVHAQVVTLGAEIHTFFTEWWGRVVVFVEEKYTQLADLVQVVYGRIHEIVVEWWEGTKAVVKDWIGQITALAVEWWVHVVTFFTEWWTFIHWLCTEVNEKVIAFFTDPAGSIWAWVFGDLLTPWAYIETWLIENTPEMMRVGARGPRLEGWVNDPAFYMERIFRPVTAEEKEHDALMVKVIGWVMNDAIPEEWPSLKAPPSPPLPMIEKE